jgi:hypothetical protein
MKKKLSLIVMLTLLACMILTGCTNPLEKFKKGSTDDTEVSTEEVDTRVTVIGTGIYTARDEVTIDDIISVDDSVAGSVVQEAILDSTGQIVNSLDTTIIGDYTVTIIVEFIEGDEWSATYDYTVESFGADEEATAAYTNVDGHNTVTSNNSTIITVVYSESGCWMMDDDLNIIGSGNNIDGSYLGVSEYEKSTLSTTDGKVYVYYGDVDTAVADVMSSVIHLQDDSSSVTDEDESDTDDASQDDMASYGNAIIDSIYTGMSSSYAGTLYSLDGTRVDVYEVYANFDYSLLTGTGDDTRAFPIGYVLQNYDANNVFYITEAQSFDVLGLSNIDIADDVSEDDLKTAVTDYFVTNGIPYYEEAYSFDTLQNTFLAGEYTGSESDDVNEVDVSSDTEEETEEKEVVSAKQTYQAKYPEVYEWPADSNGTRYSRWNYVIDSDTTFTSTIIFKDGTQMVSGNQDEDDDTSIDFSSDDYSYGTADVDGDSSAMQILVTTAGTYYIDNENMSDVIINTASSTSSVTVLSYNGNKYYIETSNSSKIDTYKETCIYSTNDMSSLDYSINSEDTKAAVTELGRIVPYTITYTDFDDATQTKGYMAVYTIDNDYLVIYADNMDDSTDTMIELLKTLVTK